MNRWLYADALKYEHEKLIMNSIALNIVEDFDESKPLCIVGEYETPYGLISDVYVPDWSKKHSIVKAVTQWLDGDLYEKYNVEGRGYMTAETPQLSTINWGIYAYRVPGMELIKFWEMHGFSFERDNNQAHWDSANTIMQGAPVWPKEGSIVEMEDHIILHLGKME